MILLSRAPGVIVVLGLALATLSTVAAASLSNTYSIEGVETAATSTQGTLIGTEQEPAATRLSGKPS